MKYLFYYIPQAPNNKWVNANNTAQKMKFSIQDFFSKCDQIRRPADLVTFTEEILNGKLHFLCSAKRRIFQ